MQRISEKKIEKLIDLIKIKPALYDKRHVNYKKVHSKEQYWLEIAEILQISVNECKVAWRSLRDQFMKNWKQMKGSSGDEAVFKKKYKYFDNLMFLKDSIEPRKTASNFEELNYNDAAFEWDELDNLPSVFNNNVSNVSSPPVTSDISTPVTPDITSVRATKRRKASENEESFQDFLKELLSQNKDDIDETDKFFLVLSSMVKKYNLDISDMTDLQCKLMLFTKEELEGYRT